MMFDTVLSNFKSSSMVIKEPDDLPIIPKALIDKLTNVTLEYAGVRSDIREAYCLFAITVDLYIGFKAHGQFNNVE